MYLLFYFSLSGVFLNSVLTNNNNYFSLSSDCIDHSVKGRYVLPHKKDTWPFSMSLNSGDKVVSDSNSPFLNAYFLHQTVLSLLPFEFKNFLTTSSRYLCVLFDDKLSIEEYVFLILGCLGKRVVFIGSDMDAHTTKSNIEKADIVFINYDTIFQPDSLNYLLENSSNQMPKVLGLMTKKGFFSSAVSFQSRWNNFMMMDLGLTCTNIEVVEDISERDVPCIRIYPELNVDLLLAKMPLEGVHEVCIYGADLETPVVSFLTALLLVRGKSVKLCRYPYPEELSKVLDPRMVSEARMIHSFNFNDVFGDFYVDELRHVQQSPPPSEICILNELSNSQWRELGYLSREYSVKLYVVSSVCVPFQITCRLYSKCVKDTQKSDFLAMDGQAKWLVSQDTRLSEFICNHVAILNDGFFCRRIIVHPDDRLLDFFMKLEHEGESFWYEKTKFSIDFENPKAVILFENLGCNPVLSVELARMCMSQSVSFLGQQMSCKSTILCLSDRMSPLYGLPVYPITQLDQYSQTEWISSKIQLENCEVRTCLEKTGALKSFLETEGLPIVLEGVSGSGKTHSLRALHDALNRGMVEIECSQIVSRKCIEDGVFLYVYLIFHLNMRMNCQF